MATNSVWFVFWYMLSPGQKYLKGLARSHPLIQGQLYCGQSTSIYTLSRLNYGYTDLQLSVPQCIPLTSLSHVSAKKSIWGGEDNL